MRARIDELLGVEGPFIVQDLLVLPKAGKLRALGVAGARRGSLTGDLPTIAESGVPGFPVAERLLVLQYIGYKSRRFDARKLRLPSMQYTVHLLRQALRRGAEVIVMRSHSEWRSLVPELDGYNRLHFAKSVRSPYLTSGNLPPQAFEAIVRAMQ